MNANIEKRDNSSEGKRRRRMYSTLPLILWLLLTGGTMALFPQQGAFRFSEYTVGSISREEVIAPFTFEILRNDVELQAERDEARRSVDPVFVRIDSLRDIQIENLRGVMRFALQSRDTVRAYSRMEPSLRRDRVRGLLSSARERYDINLNEDSWVYLLEHVQTPAWRPTPLRVDLLEEILRNIYARGVLDRLRENVGAERDQIRIIDGGEEINVPLSSVYDLSEARAVALTELNASVSRTTAPGDSSIKVSYELLVSLVVANIRYNEDETEARREAAVAKVPIAKGIVLKDERIIDSNERITERHLEMLRSMEIKRAELAAESGGWNRLMPWVARFLLVGGIYFFFGFWFQRFRQDIFRKPNKLLLIWAMMAVMVVLYGLVIQRQDLNPYLFPSALGALILTIVFDAPAALLYVLCQTFIIGLLTGNDLYAAIVAFLPAALSVFAVMRVRTRVQIMRSSLLILMGLVLLIVARRMLTYEVDLSALNDLMFASINAVATPLIALGLLILIELGFRVTSDLTLLELADLNRPLLKRLSLEAPGTYHHSIMVGNLAEAGAEAIDANPLLVRAGAYYHDIGKMVRRDYFVENQLGGGNIHDSLDPEESAKMLADHVIQGLKIADKYHLPEAIKDFIKEHHGTSMMVYFYNKALELRPEGKVVEDEFRYPGPKPQSKETGILMLADSAEAATRSLDDPQPDRIHDAVRNVIITKYRDAELDECPLTLHDLRRVTDAFVPILQGIHHHRIQYPSREELERKLDAKKQDKDGKKS